MGGTGVVAGHAGGRDAWHRLTPLWHGLFLTTLLLATAIVLLTGDASPDERLPVLALVAAFALLHLLVLARYPPWARGLGPMAAYWLLASGLLLALLELGGDAFGIVMYGLYPLMFATLGWWAMVPVVGLTALTGLMIGQLDDAGGALSVVASAGLAALVAVFVTAIARQSEQRRDALAALAATRAELAEASRQAGVLAERERLARELHDTVAQGFASVVTQLESAEQALRDRPADAQGHLEKARRTARESLGEVRRSVRALRPDLLHGASLANALDRAVRQWAADAGVPAELRTTGEPVALHPDTELALLRTAQEALANVARHAAAACVVVSLSYLGDAVTLDVHDDGVGFGGRERPTPDGGFGLIGMRERIETVGGRLSVESVPGEGTTVAASVPA